MFVRFILVANLLGVAAAICYLLHPRRVLVGAGLLIGPLPALAALLILAPDLPHSPADQIALGQVLAGLGCYLSVALGYTAAVLFRSR